MFLRDTVFNTSYPAFHPGVIFLIIAMLTLKSLALDYDSIENATFRYDCLFVVKCYRRHFRRTSACYTLWQKSSKYFQSMLCLVRRSLINSARLLGVASPLFSCPRTVCTLPFRVGTYRGAEHVNYYSPRVIKIFGRDISSDSRRPCVT